MEPDFTENIIVKFYGSTIDLGKTANLKLFGEGFLGGGEGFVLFFHCCGCFSPDLLLHIVNPTYRWNQ